MKNAFWWLSILLVFFLAACQPPEPGGDLEQLPEQPEFADILELDLENFPPAYMHEIIHPQPGEVINQSPYLIAYSGTSFGGIDHFEVWVDGSLLGTSPILGYGSGGPAYGHVFYSEYEWTPTGHGNQTIAVRARASGFQMYSEFLEVEVTVAPSMTLNAVPELQAISLLPDCTPAELGAPSLFVPEHYATLPDEAIGVPLPTDLFQWALMAGCLPDEYTLRISPDPTFNEAATRTTEGSLTIWPPEDELVPLYLEPAAQYYWTVFASADGADGPSAPARIFFTGPLCDSSQDLAAPMLLSPADGGLVNWPHVLLQYEAGEPACLPDGYLVDLQTDPEFGGPSLGSLLTSPATKLVSPELEDCTTYYWRVAAMKDGAFGPFSEVHSFHTDFEGTCPALAAEAPWVVAQLDQACYVGPDPANYPIAGYLVEGETAQIVAQDLTGLWWVVENQDADGYCFVRKADNEANGDTSGLPIWHDPDSGDTACFSNSSQSACLAAGGTWVEPLSSAPYCSCP